MVEEECRILAAHNRNVWQYGCVGGFDKIVGTIAQFWPLKDRAHTALSHLFDLLSWWDANVVGPWLFTAVDFDILGEE